MLKDKITIVTGGTRGIGFATVRTFLENRATVVLWGSKEESVVDAVNRLKATNNRWEVEGDWPVITDYASVEKAIEKVVKKYGRIDVLVNNAGITSSESIYRYEPEDFRKIMDLNVNAVFYGCRAVVPYMKAQGGGVILSTSSMVSLYGQPAGVGYPASKFAINGLTRSLARELGPDKIRVNAVAPGVTRTDMVADLPSDMVSRVCEPIPLRRMGEPQEIADAFLFLASDKASYITGAIVSVDGATET